MNPNPEKKKSEKSLKEAKMPPIPYAPKKQVEDKKELTPASTVQDALKKISEMQDYADRVEKQIEEVYRVTGWSRERLETYFSNPNNFTLADWERVNKERKELAAKMNLPQDDKNALLDQSKQRRKKGVGARRNWLPMR